MIIRSALKGVIPTHAGARLICSMSTPLLSYLDIVKAKSDPKAIRMEHLDLVRQMGQNIHTPVPKATHIKQTKESLELFYRTKDLEQYQIRKWREGDIYSPHDLSPEEMKKWRMAKPVTVDVFDTLGINPLHEYKVSNKYEFFPFSGAPFLALRKIGPIETETDFFCWTG